VVVQLGGQSSPAKWVSAGKEGPQAKGARNPGIRRCSTISKGPPRRMRQKPGQHFGEVFPAVAEIRFELLASREIKASRR